MEGRETQGIDALSAEERTRGDALRRRLQQQIAPLVHVRVDLPEAGLRAAVALGVGGLYGRPHLYLEEVLVQPMANRGPVDAVKWRAVPIRRIEDVANLPHNRERLLRLLGNLPTEAVDLDLGEPLLQEPPVALPPRPPHGAYPEAFYRGVAAHYRYHLGRDEKPAKAMAEGYGVPVRTVHGWIAEARRQGHLEPASRPGRAG